MSRPASGKECIELARKLFKSARTADELRMAQAVEDQLVEGLRQLEMLPARVQSITGWEWIISRP
jgi:hypothetical protein